MNLGKITKIIIVVSLTILIVVFLYVAINVLIAKHIYSRDIKPDLYIVPIEEKLRILRIKRK